MGETGRRLGDRFREHLRHVEINDKDASKPVARHFNLSNHSHTTLWLIMYFSRVWFDRPGESIVPRRTVVGDIDRRFDNLSGSHHQSHVNCVSSVYGIYVLT